MTQKQILFKIKGMQRDISNSTFKSEYAFENMNLRITADKDNGLLSVTNERGTKELIITTFAGGPNINVITINDKKLVATYPLERDLQVEIDASGAPKTQIFKKGTRELYSWNYTPINSVKLTESYDGVYTYLLYTDPAIYKLKTVLGVAELKDCVILFQLDTNAHSNYITKIEWDSSKNRLVGKDIYASRGAGHNELNFSLDHPIETLVDIENENIQKVYWVDGVNQPRVINIVGNIDSNDPKQFDFVPEINGGEIEVEHSEASGQFPAGVIQYAFTYFNKYGQESAVVDISPIYYIANEDKGAQPNEIVNKSFKVTFSDLDKDWDYIRLYSIIRTSVNTTPEVKKVVDIKITDLNTNNYFIDLGSTGEYVAPTDLLYKGGEVLAASTITTKDSTLFLGDISIKNTGIVEKEINNYFKNLDISTYQKIVEIPNEDFPQYTGEYNSEDLVGKYYQYTTSLNRNSFNTKHFKTNDVYRLGVQLQDKYGKWSDPIFIKDDVVNQYPKYLEFEDYLNFKGFLNIKDASDHLLSNDINIKDFYILNEDGSLLSSETEYTDFKYGDKISVTGYVKKTIWYYIGTEPGDPSSLIDKGDIQYFTDIKYSEKGDEGNLLIYYPNSGSYSIENSGIVTVTNVITNSSILKTYTISVKTVPNIGFPITKTFEISIENDNYTTFSVSKDILYWEKLNDTVEDASIKNIVNIFEVFTLNSYDTTLLEEYKKIRPVIVYPEESDRECICQGVLCPTVFNVKDRAENAPFAQPSWSWRFNLPTTIDQTEDVTNTDNGKKSGVWGEYRHMKHIRSLYDRTGNIITNGEFSVADKDNVSTCNFLPEEPTISNPPDQIFGIDSSIITMHSPDVEFNEQIKNINNVNLRIVGIVPITSNTSHNYIEGLSPDPTSTDPSLGEIKDTIHSYNKSIYGFRRRIAYRAWKDYLNYSPDEDAIKVDYWVSYWNNSKRLTYTGTLNGAVLSKSRISNFSFSNNNYFNIETISLKNTHCKVSNTSALYLNDKYYFGNQIDKIITGNTLYVAVTRGEANVIKSLQYDDYLSLWTIPITYKATKHIILDLNNKFLSTGVTDENSKEGYTFWDKNYIKYEPIGPKVESKYGFLYLAELYKDIDSSTLFGGTSDYAIQNNLWLPAGKAVNIGESITWEEGDTYYQRYDCVKTLPRNDSDLNGVTDVLSFMCETRVNLDGRYDDRYKAVEDGLAITEDNINLINPVYGQSNNFFNYRVLDTDRYNHSNLPNTIVWSKTKQSNSIVDNWTNINLVSSLDLDAKKGKVNALKVFNDNIIAFQDKAISQILFNSRVQLNTSDGVPIEISNSGKVDGKRYLSNTIGCLNKYSICDSTNGIYFIDDYNNSMYLFNGQFNNLSESKGFHSWMKNNSSLDTWDPVNFKNVVTYRDSINNEILFIYKDKCLVYNEVLGEFSSFYSYEGTPYMFTLNSKNILYNRNQNNLWVKNEGEYNNFFGTYKDFYTTIIANDNPTYDKIFSTLDFRADVLDDNNKMINSTPVAPFNYLKVVNEYQEVESNLSGKALIPKFRVWRAQFPRIGKNRIRNTWATITLGNKVNNRKGINEKVRLHDIVVNYFI